MVDLCVQEVPPIENAIPQLARSLDELSFAYHLSDGKFDQTETPDPPENDYRLARAIIEKRFPKLGNYSVPTVVDSEDTQVSIELSDAIDDLTDIVTDLQEILWRWHHTSVDDALWHFRLTFETHWGAHLRSLQWYLHHLMSESGWLLLDQRGA